MVGIAAVEAARRRGRRERMRARQGGCKMALIIGLVSIALIWLIVIYGSNYVNKNVQ